MLVGREKVDGSRRVFLSKVYTSPSPTADLSITDLSRAEMFVSIRHLELRKVSVVKGLVSGEERCRLASMLGGSI